MESKKNLNEAIRLTTLKIQEEYPELIKYMNEISINDKSSMDKGLKNKALKYYLDSLNTLINTYALQRFESHITRIEVHLKDENGNKDGFNSISCLLEARLEVGKLLL